MELIAEALAYDGWVLRSGGAPGADAAFECGCDRAHGTKEIYLPWPGCYGHASPLHEVTPAMLELAARYHPAWHKLSRKARLLIARNGAQVLGSDLASPVAAVVCWTEGGKLEGGTAQALRIAEDCGIAVVNLGTPQQAQATVRDIVDRIHAMLRS